MRRPWSSVNKCRYLRCALKRFNLWLTEIMVVSIGEVIGQASTAGEVCPDKY